MCQRKVGRVICDCAIHVSLVAGRFPISQHASDARNVSRLTPIFSNLCRIAPSNYRRFYDEKSALGFAARKKAARWVAQEVSRTGLAMYVSQIWRYPVKSMGGEKLESSSLGPLGVVGDRLVHVEDASGRFITSRTHPRLLGHRATLDSSGEPRVDGLQWTDPSLLQQVEEIVGSGARLVRDDSPYRFDVLPLLVATDGAIAAFGHDGRRLRPNVIIGGVNGTSERSWPSQRLHIRNLCIGIRDLRTRCVMTTFDPDTLRQDRRVLREIVEKFGGKLALNCYLIRGGEIHVSDDVQLVENCEHEGLSGREAYLDRTSFRQQ